MAPKELAEQLNRKQYEKFVRFHSNMDIIFHNAKMNNLVVVFGASDDLMEFRGAIDDEADCYNGGFVMLSKDGIGNDAVSKNCILAKWCDGDIAWTYETKIPHATFDVLGDEEIYCRGIVFSLEDLE